MRTLFLDYETFYSNEYSLRRMTPVEYVLDPRFECIGCAVKWEGEAARWIDGADLPEFFAGIDPAAVIVKGDLTQDGTDDEDRPTRLDLTGEQHRLPEMPCVAASGRQAL